MEYKNKFNFFHFGPCVTKFILTDEICNGLLKKGKKTNKDAREDLAGILDQEFNYNQEDQEWFINKFKDYLTDHINFLKYYHNYNFNVKVKLNNLWINYMKKNEFNPMHTHFGSLSFVIYLKVPKKLKEENKNYVGTDPSGPGGIRFMTDFKNTKLHTSALTIFPKEKECYIFPADLHHMVYPYKTNCERISVSGNLLFINN